MQKLIIFMMAFMFTAVSIGQTLVLYDSTHYTSTVSAATAFTGDKYGSVTTKSIKGVTGSNINTYISGLSAVYEYVVLACDLADDAATSKIDSDQLGDLYELLLSGSQLLTTQYIVGSGSADDSLIINTLSEADMSGKFVYVNDVSSSYTGEMALVGSSNGDTCFLSNALDAALTAGDSVLIGTASPNLCYSWTGTTLHSPVQLWEQMYNCSAPAVVYLSDSTSLWTKANGTVTSGNATTVKITTTGLTADELEDDWVYIYNASLGTGEYAQVTSNTTTVINYDAFTVSPTGGVTFRVTPHYSKIMHDKYLYYYINGYLLDLEDNFVQRQWKELLDKKLIADHAGGRGTVINTALYDEAVNYGKAISTYTDD